jgi:hypothetical protein
MSDSTFRENITHILTIARELKARAMAGEILLKQHGISLDELDTLAAIKLREIQQVDKREQPAPA